MSKAIQSLPELTTSSGVIAAEVAACTVLMVAKKATDLCKTEKFKESMNSGIK